ASPDLAYLAASGPPPQASARLRKARKCIASPASAERHVLTEAAIGPLRMKVRAEGRHPRPHGVVCIAPALRRDRAINPTIAAIHGAPDLIAGSFADVVRGIDMLRIDVVAGRIATRDVHTVLRRLVRQHGRMVPERIVPLDAGAIPEGITRSNFVGTAETRR